MIDYNGQVIPRLKFLVKEGDPEAAFELGKRYELGYKYASDDMDNQDLDLALEYYLKACELDDSYYIKLGKRFLMPKEGGFEQDGNKAFYYFSQTPKVYHNKEYLIVLEAIMLNLYDSNAGFFKAGKGIFNTMVTLHIENKNRYNYYFEAGDANFYEIKESPDMADALKCYVLGFRSIAKMMIDEFPTYKLKTKTNPCFRGDLENLVRKVDTFLKRINLKDLSGHALNFKDYEIPEKSIEECVYLNTKFSLFKVGFAFEYGLSNLSRDIKEAISYYRKALSKGCLEAGYKLILFFKSDYKKQFIYYTNTIIAAVEQIKKICQIQIPHTDFEYRSIDMSCRRLKQYQYK